MATYRERAPRALLRPYAMLTWSVGVGSHGQRPSFVPHGFPDLLWIRGEPWLGGTYRAAVIEPGAPEGTVVGIALRPGVVASWTGLAAAELVGVRLPLASVLPDVASRLVAAVGDESDPVRITTRMEEAIAGDLARLEAPTDLYASIRQALHPRGAANQNARQLAESLGTSERTLRRYCTAFFGYGPKTLERVLRIQRFLDAASRSPQTGIASLSEAAGYSDQAHLTREARVLTGMTPKAILAQYSVRRPHVAETFKTRP